MLSTGSVTLSERTYKETSFTTGQLIEVTTASNQRYNEKKMNEMTSFEDLLYSVYYVFYYVYLTY